MPADDALYDQLSFRSEGLEDYIKSHPNIGRTLDEVIDKSFYPNVKTFFKSPVRPGKGPMTSMLEKKGTDEYATLKAKFDDEVTIRDV